MYKLYHNAKDIGYVDRFATWLELNPRNCIFREKKHSFCHTYSLLDTVLPQITVTLFMAVTNIQLI